MNKNGNGNEVKEGELATVDKEKTDIRHLPPIDQNTNMLYHPQLLEHLWRVSRYFANSDMVPTQFRGNPYNCMIALQMARRLNVDEMMFMQNTYVVHGRPGMEAKLVIALINSRGPFKGPVQWRFEGEGPTRSCTAYATHAQTDELCEATVDWKMVEAEGWSKKDGSKWKTIPDLMFRYRSASFLANLYCPEVKMGMMTVDEIIELPPEQYKVEEPPSPAKTKKQLMTEKYGLKEAPETEVETEVETEGVMGSDSAPLNAVGADEPAEGESDAATPPVIPEPEPKPKAQEKSELNNATIQALFDDKCLKLNPALNEEQLTGLYQAFCCYMLGGTADDYPKRLTKIKMGALHKSLTHSGLPEPIVAKIGSLEH